MNALISNDNKCNKIIKTEHKLGIKPIITKYIEIFSFKFQLIAPIKTNIIIAYKIVKSFNTSGLNMLKKTLSIIINKNGKNPK